MTGKELLMHALMNTDDTLLVDQSLRDIYIPNSVTNLGVESDKDILSIKFKMPRYVNGIDLARFEKRINFINALGDGDIALANNVVITEDDITFDWVVGSHATEKAGYVTFNVCLRLLSGQKVIKEFNTTTRTLPVLQGLETEQRVAETKLDLLNQWNAEVLKLNPVIYNDARDLPWNTINVALNRIRAKVAGTRAKNTNLLSSGTVLMGQKTVLEPYSELVRLRITFKITVNGKEQGGTFSPAEIRIMNTETKEYDSFGFRNKGYSFKVGTNVIDIPISYFSASTDSGVCKNGIDAFMIYGYVDGEMSEIDSDEHTITIVDGQLYSCKEFDKNSIYVVEAPTDKKTETHRYDKYIYINGQGEKLQ